MLCMGPVIATGWLIFSFLICSSCRKVSVPAFCFLISEENTSSYLTALILNSELLWSEQRTVHVRTFCRVSSSPHPSGQVLSGYICPKSVLIPQLTFIQVILCFLIYASYYLHCIIGISLNASNLMLPILCF